MNQNNTPKGNGTPGGTNNNDATPGGPTYATASTTPPGETDEEQALMNHLSNEANGIQPTGEDVQMQPPENEDNAGEQIQSHPEESKIHNSSTDDRAGIQTASFGGNQQNTALAAINSSADNG